MYYEHKWTFSNVSKTEFSCVFFTRLTPVYMLIVMIVAGLYPYFGEGPFFSLNQESETCRNYWWRNMLYLNNMFLRENNSVSTISIN